MIFSIIVRKKYLYGAFKIIFSPETFSTSLGHTGDNLERRFRRHLGGRGLRESTWDCICAIADGCEEGTESAEGGGEAEGLLRCFEEFFDFKDLRILAYKRISSSGHSMHSSQRDSTEQSKPLHSTQMVWRSAVFAAHPPGAGNAFAAPFRRVFH